MDRSNLFERIEGFAGENFNTEILAHILETDARVRDAFLKLLLKRQPDLHKAFRSCGIETQPSFGYGRPDLMLTSKSKPGAAVLVEVKTQAPEGRSQIRRYLKGGHVAYLTPLGHDEPDLDGAGTENYLGEFYWHEVHSVIQKAGSRNLLHQQFLEYLEARRMGPPEPISKADIRASLHAAAVIRKFHALVDKIRKEIQPDWEGEFGKNIGGRKVSLGLEMGSFPYWWFRSKDPRWMKPNRFYLSIGVWVEKGGPYFYVALGTQKTFFRALRANRKFQRLCKDVRWKTDDINPTECCEWYKSFPVVGAGDIDEIAERQIRNIRSVKNETRKLVTFLKDSP